MKKSLVIVIFLLAALAFTSACFAHQQKESYSTILFNSRTSNIEIAHRFYIHDAEHALAQVTGKNIDLHASETARADFANYVEIKFQLKNQNQDIISPVMVGNEVEGKYFWVYQEIKNPHTITKLMLRMTALQEVWSSQINHVNVEKSGKTRSARFNKNDEWKTISLIDI